MGMGGPTVCEKILFNIIIPPVTLFIATPLFAISKIFTLIYIGIRKLFCSTQISEECHEKKVKFVQEQVNAWNQNGRKTKMCSARPAAFSIATRPPNYKGTMTKIQMNMGKIIRIDTQKQVVRVEPLVRMGRLSSYLIKRGWIVPVIPELNDLTVGGMICGTGIETSCHKYGLFQDICVAFEVVLANGNVVNCSKDENPDLFHTIPMSHGTVGFLMSATLRVIPAKKYVELEYIPIHNLDEAVSVFESQTLRENENDFVEGIMFGLDKGVVMVGKMVDAADKGKVNSIDRWYKPWFFKHVESFLRKPNAESGYFVEYIPLRAYLHRHNKTAFWMHQMAFPFGNNILFRWIFEWMFPLRISFYQSMTPVTVRSWGERIGHILQDFMIPLNKLKEHLIFTHQVTGVYPIWLCPVKIFPTQRLISSKTGQEEMYVDIGIYGVRTAEDYDFVKTAKKLEALCIQNGGFQFTYANLFLSREEFLTMFNHELYFKTRKEFGCEDAFPEIYDKVCKAARQ